MMLSMEPFALPPCMGFFPLLAPVRTSALGVRIGGFRTQATSTQIDRETPTMPGAYKPFPPRPLGSLMRRVSCS